MIDDSQYFPSHPSSLAFISFQDSADTSGIEPMAAATDTTIHKHDVRLSKTWLGKRGRDTDLKKGAGWSNLLFARANIWSQVKFIADILVRPPYAPQLWMCGLKIMNRKHVNREWKILTGIQAIDLLSILFQMMVSQQSGFTKMVAVN